jgi:nitric oxide reductase subunit B
VAISALDFRSAIVAGLGGTDTARLIEWLRLPGDPVFIIFGAVPLTIAAIKGYIGVRATRRSA